MDQDLRDALSAAIQAASDGGAVLRQDFLKPGGPSGAGSHAAADLAAEHVIRRRLLAATPECGYLCEETGRGGAASAEYVWLVDPNDGTASYLQGYRGSAVSIALLRGGTPVLGVVYAFAAPDNQGDLFAWAEGCGPLRRNGVPVTRAPWQTHLTDQTTVIVSQAADHATAANLACVAPGRYRAEPSIAYRLALAAAGDGEAGASLNGARDWDYAGGHALLRAVDGELVDDRGRPITYTKDGQSSAARCFGGAPRVVSELSRRPWQSVFTPADDAPAPYDLCWPQRGWSVADAGRLERAQGCLLGQLAGDALGSMVEFMGAARIQRERPEGLRQIGPSPVFNTLAGQPTDDSELALILARTLLHQRAFVEDEVAAAYAYWLRSGPFDVGGTIGTATRAMLDAQRQPGASLVEAAHAAANQGSAANGALMRQSPLAIWGHALAPEALAGYVRADTRLTHPNPVCQDASAAFIVALAAVIREGLTAEEAYERARAWDHAHGSSPSVTAALAAARREPPRYEQRQGHVLIALRNAFYQALHCTSLEDGVIATVLSGGDTDTNAAIAGALLGALHGARGVPAQWWQSLLTCRPQHGAAGVRTPRPRAFWPVDAPRLAEYLVVAGGRVPA